MFGTTNGHSRMPAVPDNLEILRAVRSWAARNYPGSEPIELVLRFADKRKLLLPIPAASRPQGTSHSADFRSVNWFGTVYSFTSNQAAVVRQLWEAWESGTPEVGDQTLLVNADINSERIDAIFRDHPAWKTMIQPGQSKGTRHLVQPRIVAEAEIPRHAPDFRSINWFGAEYRFTPYQSTIVRQLWEAWERGTPVVGQASLLEGADSHLDRLRDLFRDHPAWGTVIVSDGRGSYRLQVPN